MKTGSLRLQMLAVMAASLAVIWAAVYFELSRNRARIIREAEISAVFQAQLFAENTKSVFKRLDEVLFDLRAHWSDEEKQFTQQVQKQIEHIGDIAFQIGVIDKNGILAYSNLKKAIDKDRVDLSEREHFKVHVGSGRDRLFISKPLKGKVSGRWSIQFTRAIYDREKFDGVIVLSADPKLFVRFHEQLSLGAAPALAIVADDGSIMARYPDNDEHMGKKIAGAPYLEPAAAPTGHFRRVAQVDGIERIYSYYKLPEYGLNFLVGKSVAEVLAPYTDQRNFILAAAGLVSLGLSLLILVLYRSLEARQHAVKELHDSEERFRRMTDLTLVGIIIHDGKKIIDVNPAFCRQFGYAPGTLIGLGFDMLLTPSSRAAVRRHVEDKHEEPYEVEGLRKDGTLFPAELKGVNVVYNGIPVRVASVTDISDRKRAEEELRQSEERYHNLFAGSKVPMLLIDPQSGDIVDANPAAAEFYGYDEETLKRMNISGINTATREEVAHEMERAKEDKRSHFHFRHRLASGQLRDVEVHSGPIRLSGRTILYSLIHDETVRVRLEREHRKLIRAIEQSPVSILITDVRGDIEYVNPKFLEITGYELQEVLGQNPRFLKSGKTLPETYRQLWGVIARGGEWHGELCNRKKNGDIFWEQASITSIADAKGDITHYLGVKEDITEKRRINEELARSHVELEQFAYVASHDLRQPLRMVTSYLQLIERRLGPALEGDLKEFIGYAAGGARRMDQLIVGLLEYSRTGRNAEPIAQVDLNEIIKESLLNLEVSIAEAKAEVVVAQDFPSIRGHWMELVRLFQNLIGNAVKYRRKDAAARIELSCRREGSDWVVLVQDNGIGMDPKDHDRAFIIFQRLVGNGEYEGTGLGLAICKKIVERHKGRIWVESALGEGCRFYIAFPAFDA
ncbi:MAG: PAS domain S-box protein [Rhodospirillales bacterium]|nr:PAS domain S-box protein [Rhodospirillales bacterium]